MFVGLLAALQVDEWRENRDYFEAETRYLNRLNEDLVTSINTSGGMLELLKRHHEMVASGMFARLGSDKLKRVVAELYSVIAKR